MRAFSDTTHCQIEHNVRLRSTHSNPLPPQLFYCFSSMMAQDRQWYLLVPGVAAVIAERVVNVLVRERRVNPERLHLLWKESRVPRNALRGEVGWLFCRRGLRRGCR
jgi:hypothetical protein